MPSIGSQYILCAVSYSDTAPIGIVFEALCLWKPDRTQLDVVGDDYAIPIGYMGEVKFFPREA